MRVKSSDDAGYRVLQHTDIWVVVTKGSVLVLPVIRWDPLTPYRSGFIASDLQVRRRTS